MAISKITTGSISDSVAIDTDTLVVDGANNRVGVGTTSPASDLHVVTSDYKAAQFEGPRPTLFFKETDGNANENYQIRLNGGGLLFQSQNDVQSNAVDRMTIDSSGRVTMPYQPAWHLQPSWTSNTTPSTNSIIPFGVYGGHGTFATSVTVSSGRVTVPVSGKYWIASTMRQENSQTDYQISLRKNGAQYIRSGIWYSSQAYENIHLMGMVNLAANDYLEIDINSSNMPPINGNTDTLTFFSGYLVS